MGIKVANFLEVGNLNPRCAVQILKYNFHEK